MSTLITDLDDTLYSWIDVWHRSFGALLDRLSQDSGVPRDLLLREIRAVHQRHRTPEYAFLVEELPSLQSRHPGGNIARHYRDAIEAFRLERDQALILFPGVMQTLQTIRERGCLVIAYTESMGLYTNYRLKRLGLDGVIDVLYSPEDHDYPSDLTTDQLLTYTAKKEALEHTTHRYTPMGERKPNPQVLRDIMDAVGAVAAATIYVGDKPFKDVAMARKANVRSVLAAYGDPLLHPGYDLLRSVTHWSDEDVEREVRERDRLEKEGIGKPDYELRRRFGELLDLFEFVPHTS